jgi:ABC-type oligopeptide transport system substrate-binding subunit
VPDPERGWADLEAGRVDVAEVPPGKLPDARKQYGTAGFSPVAAGVYLGFNLKDPRVADIALRRAVSLAIDRTAVAGQVYEDVLVPATSIVPVGIPGRNELACGPLCRHDPDGARALLAQSSAGQVTVAFDYPSGATQDALAAAIGHNLAEVGIQLQPRPRPLPEFLDLLEAEGQESFRVLWVAEYPLADWFLTPLFAPAARDNHTGYDSPEVGDLLRRARSAPEREERLRLYREAEARVMQDLPVIPIGFFRNHYAARSTVRGLDVDQLGAFDVEHLTLRAP